MNENKTRPSSESVQAYLDAVAEPGRRENARALCSLFRRVTGEEPELWGGSMFGFGRYKYRYESGREGEWLATGFAAGSNGLVVYLMADSPQSEQQLARLGKHRTGKSCLYLKRLADVDIGVLEQLIRSSLQALRERYPES